MAQTFREQCAHSGISFSSFITVMVKPSEKCTGWGHWFYFIFYRPIYSHQSKTLNRPWASSYCIHSKSIAWLQPFITTGRKLMDKYCTVEAYFMVNKHTWQIGVRCCGMKANPTRYLWCKYEQFSSLQLMHSRKVVVMQLQAKVCAQIIG